MSFKKINNYFCFLVHQRFQHQTAVKVHEHLHLIDSNNGLLHLKLNHLVFAVFLTVLFYFLILFLIYFFVLISKNITNHNFIIFNYITL